MKVILLKDVKNQGKKDDIIDVSPGYAKNYLFNNKLAVLYTEGSKKVLDAEIKQRQDAEDALVAKLNTIKNKLQNQTISFKVKVGANDKVFGTISSKQISDKLKEMNYSIDKKDIHIPSSIDSLGNHEILIKLHKKVEFNIIVNLTR